MIQAWPVSEVDFLAILMLIIPPVQPLKTNHGGSWGGWEKILATLPPSNTSVDMWAAGCVLGEMLLHQPLFAGKDPVLPISTVTQVTNAPQ